MIDWLALIDFLEKLNIMLGVKTYFINRCKTPKNVSITMRFCEHYIQEKILMRYCNAITKGRWDSFDLFECAIYSTNYFLFALERIHALKGEYSKLLYFVLLHLRIDMIHKDLLWIGNVRYAEDNDHKLMVFAQNQRREWNATNMVVAFSYIRTIEYLYLTFHNSIILYIHIKP